MFRGCPSVKIVTADLRPSFFLCFVVFVCAEFGFVSLRCSPVRGCLGLRVATADLTPSLFGLFRLCWVWFLFRCSFVWFGLIASRFVALLLCGCLPLRVATAKLRPSLFALLLCFACAEFGLVRYSFSSCVWCLIVFGGPLALRSATADR